MPSIIFHFWPMISVSGISVAYGQTPDQNPETSTNWPPKESASLIFLRRQHRVRSLACALMTGLHAGHAWIRGNSDLSLRPEDVTVAELLKAAGYHTGIARQVGLGLGTHQQACHRERL